VSRLGTLAGIACLLFVTMLAGAQSLVTAANFGVLARTGVANSGATVVDQNLGISPNGAGTLTGFPLGLVMGQTHTGDAIAAQALTDALAARATITGHGPGTALGNNLNGLILTDPFYTIGANANLGAGSTLTFSGAGVHTINIGSSFNVGDGASILLTGGATADDIFINSGTVFTSGIGDTLFGTFFSNSANLGAGTQLTGRILATGTTVVLNDNHIINPAAVVTPEPGSFALAGGLLIALSLGGTRSRRRKTR
jgi:hypothetical protein